MITIELNDEALQEGLARLTGLMSDLSPVMKDLGELLMLSTKERFPQGVAPDGTPWAPKAAATIERYLSRGDRADSRPLFGPSGALAEEIFYDAGPDQVEIGSNRIYAAVMQFGAAKGAFGPYAGVDKKGRRYSGTAPWGNIPARPFLGLSDEDEVNLVATVEEWLARVAGGGA